MASGLSADMTKRTVDQATGIAAQKLNVAFLEVQNAKAFLDVLQEADLEALGYTANDVAVLRSALADLDQLRRIYQGGEALAAAKDFRTFAERMWGTGYTGQ